MKKTISLLLLFLIIGIQAQEKTLINKGEITIPIGKKIILKPLLEGDKIVNLEIVKEENITDKIDLMSTLKTFKKDNTTDNSIEFSFSEAKMMDHSLFALITVQKTAKLMTFKAKIRLKGSSLYTSTSIMPVPSNANSVEEWRDTIDSIFLYDFKLGDEFKK
ncbi:hypothetical protein CEY12_21565 [Chryseobacterium sp. T16E-39]|uniref:hypothetical protein n=1 Tax=Chryseobacterium sp. T16E-39 TaxID=2015076 RepID=UPI000B5B34F9|nr:hypothetical protein [Chryseobacterium sp. T16E-39]ASK32513.1 hypothetical protein CEY12_21565 [Chryseobacterium sp. T16E-39]